MDFRELQYILAIARHQNMTKAAESLYVGQPTLSKFLSSHEQKIGLKLFKKAGHKYMLTYAGERYVEKAVQILRLKDDLDSEMMDIIQKGVGVLKVAFANMRCTYMLPAVLPAFHRLHPNVNVSLYEGSSSENDRRLLAGEIDIAFYTFPAQPDPMIKYIPLSEEELLICTCLDFPLKEQAVKVSDSHWPRLDLDLLQNERILLMQPQQRTRQIMDQIFREKHISFGNVLCTSSIPAILGLVSEGYGVSFIFDAHLNHFPDRNRIDCFSLGDPRAHTSFVASVRKGGYLPCYALDFIEIVRNFVTQNLSQDPTVHVVSQDLSQDPAVHAASQDPTVHTSCGNRLATVPACCRSGSGADPL